MSSEPKGSGIVASAGVDSDMVEDEELGWREGILGTEAVPVLYAGVVYNNMVTHCYG